MPALAARRKLMQVDARELIFGYAFGYAADDAQEFGTFSVAPDDVLSLHP
jgi:hypothetical protein